MHFMKFQLIFQWNLEGKRNEFKGLLDLFLGYREKGKWRFTTNQLIIIIFDPHTNSIEFNGFDTGIEQR